MLQIILMLLGLAFPNSDANTVFSNNQTQTTVENPPTQNTDSSDTGGDTAQVPPR